MKVPDQKVAGGLPKLRPFLLGTTGGLTAIMGGLSLVGWILGVSWLTTLGTGRIPMSPMTGALFFLLGVAVVVQSLAAPSRWQARGAVVLAGAVGFVALLSLGYCVTGLTWQGDHLGFAVADSPDIPRVGHMLPATSIFFVLAGLVFVLTQVSRFVVKWTAMISLAGSFLLWAAGIVFLFRYLMDAQPLHPISRVTPALGTVLGMIPLSLALMVLGSRFGASQRDGVEIPRSLYGIFVLLGTAIVVAGSIYYNRFEEQFNREAEERLVGILATKARRLAEWRSERLSDGDFYFDNSSFAARMRRLSVDPDDQRTRGYLNSWLAKSRATADYDQSRLLDPAGKVLLSLPDGLPPASTDTLRAAAAATQSGRPLLQDVYWHEHDGLPRMAIVVPVVEEPGQPALGTVVLRIDPAKRLFALVKEWPIPTEPVKMALIRREGDQVAILNQGSVAGGAASAGRIPLQKIDSVLVRATADPPGLYFGVNARNEPVLAAARSVHDSPWKLVAMIDPAQMSAPLSERVWAVLLLVAVVLFGIAAALSVVWRHQRAGFLREQLEVAEALRESEGRFRRVLETMSLIGVVLDPKGTIVLCNDHLALLTGWQAAELLGRNWFEVFLPPEIRAGIEDAIFLKAVDDGSIPEHYENEILTRSGGRRLVSWNNTVLRDGLGAVTGVASIGEDITERRATEVALLASLREKEALLKEVHHRVKNNLQVVASLLRLESGRSEHVLTKYVLQEMHGRIRAMALLHESLYRTATFDRIGLAGYFRQLLAYLSRSVGHASGAVQFELKLAEVEVGADEAIPCGLIINELVTNSVKHGFPDGRTGVVTIELEHAAAEGTVRLRVSDNGVGLPAGFDPAKSKSLGLQLVSDLARQLDGRLEVGPGAAFTVIFKAGPLESIMVPAPALANTHG